MKYSIGLDIGTTSVGYACINEKNEILQYQNKYAWGVREFEAAQTAETTRVKRQMRRRYNRRKKRIQLIQQLFAPHVPSHFFKQSDSKHFWKNDNQFENRALPQVLKSLKINPKQIPTIYHLRQYLMESNEQYDIRLIYLAIHNLTKYRGHFLNTGRWTKQQKGFDFKTECSEIVTYFSNINDMSLEKVDFKKVEEVFDDIQLTRKDKQKLLVEMTTKKYEPLWQLLLGLSVDAAKLFSISEQSEHYKAEKLKLQLGSEEFDEVKGHLTEAENQFLDDSYVLYQQIMLQDLLQGHECVAYAKVASYEKYQEDLKVFKEKINAVGDEKLYRRFFITPKKAMRDYMCAPKKENLQKLCLLDQYNLVRQMKEKETVLKEMAKMLKSNIPDDEKLMNNIKEGLFLAHQRGTHNAAIPNQNSIYEIEQIFKNQRQYYDFMTDEWIEKVIEIVSFRIPYYIGPLSKNDNSDFGWVVRKGEGPITPATFNEYVDASASAEQFIRRMTNSCTHLKDQDVLPKHALLYQYFEVLNELNSIQIRPANEPSHRKYRLSPEAKKCVIEKGFKKYKAMTHKRLLQVLKDNHFDALIEDGEQQFEVYGTQQEKRFGSNLASFIDFTTLFEEANVPFDEKMVEQIIEWLTVFSEKSIVETKIKEVYPNLPLQLIEKISKKHLAGWGRFSRKLLDGLVLNDQKTVIEKMNDTTLNFMEVLSKKNSNLEEKIQVHNKPKHETKKITYADIQDLAGSPALKRGVWQAVKIVEELTTLFGEPTHIMLEVAREEGEKKRTKSRYAKFKELVDGLGKDEKTLKTSLAAYLKQPEEKFKDNRFYLYLLQEGKCAYCGKSLNINHLSDYEMDHIYPQNFVKDDSLDNLVLVEKSHNQHKSGHKLPLEMMTAAEAAKMRNMWKSWLAKGFITERKYYRLTKPSFTEIDKENFIARQLVETRQIIKNVGVLLEERFANTEVHLVKAPIVSKFRKALELPKLRDYNNKHHAVDALLNAILINHAIQKYGHNIFAFSFNDKERSKKLAQIAQHKNGFFLFNSFLNEKMKSALFNETVSAKRYVEEAYYYLPWQTTKKVGSSDGMFYKETLFSPKIKEAKYDSTKAKIGVYSEVKPSKTVVVTYVEKRKKKHITKTEFMKLSVLEEKQWQSISDDEKAYRLATLKYPKKEIIAAKWQRVLPKYQKIIWNDQQFSLVSNDELHLAEQFVLSEALLNDYIHGIKGHLEPMHLQVIYEEIANQMFEQYPVYAEGKMPEKVAKFKEEIETVEGFKKHVGEIFKATYNGGMRSDSLGSRLSKALNPEEVQVVYASVTGLKVRKPISLRNLGGFNGLENGYIVEGSKN